MQEIKPYMDNLELVLTSPRERAVTTIASYLSTARTFLTWMDNDHVPTDRDLRRFFLDRKSDGISASTRSLQFVQLRKLFEANSWKWPFTKDDRPVVEDEPNAPAFSPDEVLRLIANRDKYTPQENFYLVLAVTYGLRREEIARITPRDIKENSIIINVAKMKKKVMREQPIPEQIKPILAAWKPRVRRTGAISYCFHKIMVKSGIGDRKGWGFHSLRRTMFTMLMVNLAKEGYQLSWAADYLRWSKKSIGMTFMGASMAGIYAHPEVLSDDRMQVDRICQRLDIHPFLAAYAEKIE